MKTKTSSRIQHGKWMPAILCFSIALMYGCNVTNDPLMVEPEVAAPQSDSSEPSGQEDWQRLNEVTFTGPISGDEITFTAYLPDSYFDDSTRDYPVLYHLHGLNGRHNGRQVETVPAFYEEAWAAGIWEEAIIIFPDGLMNSMWSNDFAKEKLVETHVIKEILPYVDEHFRTIPRMRSRFIEGFSMGGFGALKLFVKFPGKFSSVVSFDGALHTWETLVGRRPEIAAEIFDDNQQFFEVTADPRTFLTQRQDNFKTHSRMLIIEGGLRNYNQSMKDFLESLAIKHTYLETGCNHALGCVLYEAGIETVAGFFE